MFNIFNAFKGTFSGRVNKMWAGGLAVGVVNGLASAFGIEFSPLIQTALVAVITGGVIYKVPNKGT